MKTDFLWLAAEVFDKGLLKRLVFSKPTGGDYTRVCGRIAKTAKGFVLALEYSHISTTVSHKNLTLGELEGALFPLFDSFMQVNLHTAIGDAEYKRKKSGEQILLGAAKLKNKLKDTAPVTAEVAIEALDRRKNYLAHAEDAYLYTLGISDKNGRVHDKMQGKFRQIHRFLENVEAIYSYLPEKGTLRVYDLCCGKSYLSFALYHYLTEKKGRDVDMLCVDLKHDVIDYCEKTAGQIGFSGMRFLCEDIRRLQPEGEVHLVVSLHACDIATDIVLETAARIRARAVLSTPCCQKYLYDRIEQSRLAFATEHGHLRRKLCDVLTDGLRALFLEKEGYRVQVCELTDPQDTPKNTLLRAVLLHGKSEKAEAEYRAALTFLLGDKADNYLKELRL